MPSIARRPQDLSPRPDHVLEFRCGCGGSRLHDSGGGFDTDDGAANRNGAAFRDVPVNVERPFPAVLVEHHRASYTAARTNAKASPGASMRAPCVGPFASI